MSDRETKFIKEYTHDLRREFAFYGFTTCPLTESEMKTLFRLGYSASDAYGIGCDVSAGFYFGDVISEERQCVR